MNENEQHLYPTELRWIAELTRRLNRVDDRTVADTWEGEHLNDVGVPYVVLGARLPIYRDQTMEDDEAPVRLGNVYRLDDGVWVFEPNIEQHAIGDT